ncbi:MAG: YncE family protein [Vicinamibacteria bacterium]
MSCRIRFPILALAGTLTIPGLAAEGAPRAEYYVYVCAESDDTVDLIKFGPDGGELLKRVPVGIFPNEIEGPHGLKVHPNGRHWFVSIAHGLPYGSVFKYETGTDLSVADTRAGLFPASMDINPLTGFLFVVNFNLHGDMVPSTMSVIDTVSMSEIAQIDHGIMPHGSRFGPDGKYSYSVGMMSDDLIEIDAMQLKVSRRLLLTKDDAPPAHHGADHAGADHAQMAVTKPTWAHPHPAKPLVYVALQGVDQVAEVDLKEWKIVRRFHTRKGPYNLGVSPDGRILIVTEKLNHSTAFWDVESGKELANVATTRRLPHGVAVSPDSRLAFISVEGVGGDPGTVEVFDLETFERLAAIDVGKQASGIDFWKMAPLSAETTGR